MSTDPTSETLLQESYETLLQESYGKEIAFRLFLETYFPIEDAETFQEKIREYIRETQKFNPSMADGLRSALHIIKTSHVYAFATKEGLKK